MFRKSKNEIAGANTLGCLRRLALLCACLASVNAQTDFVAELSSSPSGGNRPLTGSAHFSLSDSRLAYEIGIRFDSADAALAILSGPLSEVSFDLGTPMRAIHAPGDLELGAALYKGVFELPDDARGDLILGASTLAIPGVRARGSLFDLSGRLQPVPEPGVLLLGVAGIVVLLLARRLKVLRRDMEPVRRNAPANETSVSSGLKHNCWPVRRGSSI